ncbi:tRNA-specific 2-thiouridylase MnmA [hydrothermal vent metagenome]|uniref:tRNA-specific 2-thiouridylase MnmA n=1 Tax=hydrothermal vent metagenome TaxID=652676 RepID=A0A3B0SMA0_9ZZZZ
MKALVAMSGGVDSSVAAALMLEAGYDVIGVTLKQWEGADGEMPTAGCCTVGDAEDARRAAAQLDIPYYVLDYVDEFTEKVVRRFGEIYMQGRTPNPCIECNRTVRFHALLDRTTELGCDILVTGHHARVTHDADGYHLRRGHDDGKDQSYVLHMLGQDELSRIQLPIGEITKTEVRDRARRLGLRTADKPDSQDLCFVGDGDYRSFLREYFPETVIPGKVVTTEGEVVGDHAGTIDFTIGQRKGLGVAVGEPRYVVDIEPQTAVVTIGRREDLLAGGCLVEELTFVSGSPPTDAAVAVKIRYRSNPIDATLELSGDRSALRFASPQIGVAPGQAAVLYRDDEVLGGGTISAAIPCR